MWDQPQRGLCIRITSNPVRSQPDGFRCALRNHNSSFSSFFNISVLCPCLYWNVFQRNIWDTDKHLHLHRGWREEQKTSLSKGVKQHTCNSFCYSCLKHKLSAGLQVAFPSVRKIYVLGWSPSVGECRGAIGGLFDEWNGDKGRRDGSRAAGERRALVHAVVVNHKPH